MALHHPTSPPGPPRTGQGGEGVRVQEPEQPRERVMARDAVLRRQDHAEELLLRSSGQLEIEAAFRFAQRRG
jgi:hypothetical protein